ncbi:C40 family peptidase [Paenibacillus sp. ACRRX]|uniref:C40 family peptidase n=1 Tax=Paenibacillus sp. ACRRX TaxID=2918206 RepID=UPI001EF70E53|nr:SH3 domain-containing C40 family peptidase [Paenibacillus sp. ACRRX]MCG7409025.1 C40 family peptidase [Paenibacillus sp. ACRRX]
MKKMKKLLLGMMMMTMASQMLLPAVGVEAAPSEPDFMITSPALSDTDNFLMDESDPDMEELEAVINEYNAQNATASRTAATATSSTGVILASVNMREKASTSGKIIRLVKQGEKVTILSRPNSSWYQVRDEKGKVGYLSSSSKYIKVGGQAVVPDDKESGSSALSASSKVEKVISTGLKYLGTPYEYGSDRNSTRTFDCSDFVRHAFKQAIGITLPADSRKQGAYVKSNSTVKKSISSLKRGDLMFFGTYRGSKQSAYKNVNKNTERITHVGIYMGNGKVLHTYSKASGGVRTDSVVGNSWEHRFLYGGSVVK